MKLASYRDGSRDGQLVVVSRDLSTAHFAAGVASRLAHLLDDWNYVSPRLEDLYATLNGGKARHAFPFDPARCMPPLPRPPGCWRPDGALAHRLDGPEGLVGATESPAWPSGTRADGSAAGLAFEPGLGLLMGDVAIGRDAAQAVDGIRLVAATLHWSIGPASHDGSAPDAAPANGAADDGTGTVSESERGRCSLGTSFSPVAVTPDELPAGWAQGSLAGRLSLVIAPDVTGSPVPGARSGGWCGDLGALIAGCVRWRPLGSGQVVIAARGDAVGVALEPTGGTVRQVAPRWLVRLEASDAQGQSIFGSIEARAVD